MADTENGTKIKILKKRLKFKFFKGLKLLDLWNHIQADKYTIRI